MTILMMAKMLQRPIYLVEGCGGLDNASYQIFKPIHKVTKTQNYMTSRGISYKECEATQWISALQQNCKISKDLDNVPLCFTSGSFITHGSNLEKHLLRKRYTGSLTRFLKNLAMLRKMKLVKLQTLR
ncbi:hypothetical protein PHMEG_00019940 [Phytophthora megakarya]|uniref:Uncharacterized protein n=1 Tax=Phytophthora megakarya TaxID=4795 RepID=A0A225VQ34_9STRA|nr:hypothetical protein PHMEG_00019940 [Phytophthora megakarya]